MIGLAVGRRRAAVQVFPLRDGALVDRYSFHLENVAGQDLETVVEEFCLGYYGAAPSIPPEIVMPKEVGRPPALEELLTERRGARVGVRARFPRRQAPARRARDEERGARARSPLRRTPSGGSCAGVAALEELREALNLESLPVRIECFDISTTQGAQTVGSMVVFQDAQPRKRSYRKFAIRRPSGRQDDYAAIAEVLSRRFARCAACRRALPDWDESFAADPEPRRRRRGQGAAVGGARGDARSTSCRA